MKKNGASTSKRNVTLYPSRKQIEVAPDVKIAPMPKEEMPEIAIARWQAVGDGSYRPILTTHEVWIRITQAARLLHVPYWILMRLCKAGFVKSTQPSPGFYQIDLSSWFEHMEKIRQDPDFWLNEKNRKRYHQAI